LTFVRLVDVAYKAGFSVNTVSRALKGKSDIGIATQKRIRQIADELGYVPHAAAASLRNKTTKTIGVILTFMDNPFYSRILNGINGALLKHGYTALTWGNNEDVGREEQILRTFISYRVDGILTVPARNLVNTIDYDSLNICHMTIVRQGPQNCKDHFGIDSRRSGVLVARHFLEKGRKMPAYIGMNIPISCDRDRWLGYKETCEEAGILPERRNVKGSAPSSKEAYLALKQLIEEKVSFDCLFVGNDQLAFGALRALYDLGVRVPEDVAVVGHDDVESAQFATPSLSTVRVPKFRLGFESTEALIAMIGKGKEHEGTAKVYEPKLIVRETS
jgi:LacI family transcriptional regulator, galactose operon repressor